MLKEQLLSIKYYFQRFGASHVCGGAYGKALRKIYSLEIAFDLKNIKGPELGWHGTLARGGRKTGGLELVDLELAKKSLLCKWIVHAMELGESNLQIMLRCRLAHYNPQRGRSWGLTWKGSSSQNTKVAQGPKCGITLPRPGNTWLLHLFKCYPSSFMGSLALALGGLAMCKLLGMSSLL